MVKKYLPIVILLLLTIPSIWFLLLPGFFESDDGEWMVIRFSAFYQSLSDGQFPVRFLGRLNHGYGYPVANFLYPGFMYLAIPIKAMSFSFVDSIKIILIASMIFSGLFAFFWLRKIFDDISSFAGALFYAYAPYHLFDLYKRGSVGEVLSLAVTPFVLWQIERNSIFWSSIGIALLILSHNTIALMFVAFSILYMLFNIYVSSQKKMLSLNYLLMIVLGFGMSSFFWVPAISELKYTIFSQTSISDPYQYFSNSNLIGIPTLLILGIVVTLFITRRIQINKHRLTVLMFAVAVLSLFFAIELSAILWRIFPVSFIQFPFRFLSVTILSVAFLASCIVSVVHKNYKISIALALIIMFFVSAYPHVFSYKKTVKDDSFYFTNEATTTVKDEYMPKWVKNKPDGRYREKVEIVEGSGQIKNLSYNDSKKISFDIEAATASRIRINTIYYPGWKAYVDGNESKIDYSNDAGVVDVDVGKGSSRVEFVFTETPLRFFADVLSLSSLVILISFALKTTYIRRVSS